MRGLKEGDVSDTEMLKLGYIFSMPQITFVIVRHSKSTALDRHWGSSLRLFYGKFWSLWQDHKENTADKQSDIQGHTQISTLTLSSSSFLCIIGEVDPSSPSVLLHWLPTSWTTWTEKKKTFIYRHSLVSARLSQHRASNEVKKGTLSHRWACSLLWTAKTSASPPGNEKRNSWRFFRPSLGT